jgi:hypothetical protein
VAAHFYFSKGLFSTRIEQRATGDVEESSTAPTLAAPPIAEASKLIDSNDELTMGILPVGKVGAFVLNESDFKS